MAAVSNDFLAPTQQEIQVWIVPVETPSGKIIVRSYELEDGTFVHAMPDWRSGGFCRTAVLRNRFPLRGDCSCEWFANFADCGHLALANDAENIIGDAQWQENQWQRGSDEDAAWWRRLREAEGEVE